MGILSRVGRVRTFRVAPLPSNIVPFMRSIIATLIFFASALPRVGAKDSAPKEVDFSKLPPAASAKVDFARDIQPLLADRCVKCHGPEKQKGGLRLDAKGLAMQGGDDGKIIESGKSAESRLIHLVAGLEADTVMPPKDKGERLTGAQIGLLRAWIDQGVSWPGDGKVARVRSEHWSLQPLKKPAPPVVVGSATEVDAFILAKLAAKGLALSPEADPRTLIRRLSYDLTGLPPTPEEVEAFVESYGTNGTNGTSKPHDSHPSYRALVEKLLASPRYGERWGRHWLDVARYTESQGFEYDKPRENAWPYRDYVIRSFNDDKPYDRFMREQVAGDVLEPVTPDGMIAPSLLVCGPWDEAGNAQANATQKMITREDELEDLLGVVGQSFLGLTVNCARCHTHKFDPIPHEDYYRMKAVFAGVKHGERTFTVAEAPRQSKGRREELEKEIAAAEKQVAEIEAAGAKVASARRPATAPAPGPAALARWTFDGAKAAVMPGTLHGGAEIVNGRLKLGKPGAFFKTAPLPKEIGARTLEAWVALATLEQGGGGVISLESSTGAEFDAIVFGERQPKKWLAGSASFARTQDLEVPAENASPGVFVHVAIVYGADRTISFFRNGEPAGKPYRAQSLATYKAGDGHVLLGLRHTGAGAGFLTGEIQQAALYDRALSPAEIMASFRAGGASVSQAEILDALPTDQRAAREAALAGLEKARVALKALAPVTPPRGETSYVGTRTQPAPTKRLVRGDVHSPAEVVTPGALSAVFQLEADFGLSADAPEAQRRLKFADWLADARHPLPARVMVNRLWHWHFGQGLVATPNDFGASGASPTHPELLDWLAGKFIESGWSVKALHRLIVNSAAYRQSSESSEKAAALDADNTLLWRYPPRRLEAEAVRDAMLFVSGQIDLKMGGPSFKGASYESGKAGAVSNRRTVYRMNVNSGKDPLLDAFDCPDPAVKTPRRGVTITPLQALELMNNAFVQRQAKGLADRALKAAAGDPTAAIQHAYRLALGRPPTARETERAAAAAEARDLTGVCWALLNSTEFVYVR